MPNLRVREVATYTQTVITRAKPLLQLIQRPRNRIVDKAGARHATRLRLRINLGQQLRRQSVRYLLTLTARNALRVAIAPLSGAAAMKLSAALDLGIVIAITVFLDRYYR